MRKTICGVRGLRISTKFVARLAVNRAVRRKNCAICGGQGRRCVKL